MLYNVFKQHKQHKLTARYTHFVMQVYNIRRKYNNVILWQRDSNNWEMRAPQQSDPQRTLCPAFSTRLPPSRTPEFSSHQQQHWSYDRMPITNGELRKRTLKQDVKIKHEDIIHSLMHYKWQYCNLTSLFKRVSLKRCTLHIF